MYATEAPAIESHSWIPAARRLVEDRLSALLGNPRSPVMEAMRYSVLAPGKRIRPLLTLAVSDFLGGPRPAALQAACAIEMIHCASLVLDDLPCMDDDRERRSRLCTHLQYGESVAILAAVSLLAQSQCVIASDDALSAGQRLGLIQLLCETVGPHGLSLGQYMDLHAGSALSSVDAITDMHHLKTGVLFLAAARAGCLVAGAAPEREARVMAFTRQIGLAFQLRDDIRDMGGDGVNIAARIGLSEAGRRLRSYLDAALTAIDGEGDAQVLRGFVDAVFA
jgi:geranylgeranyl diphosphate synthase type II